MIVNQISTGWEIIYQRAHAMLAAQTAFRLAAHWHVGDRPARMVETIAAIIHHDDLAKEWETATLSSAGTPLDFTLSVSNEFSTPDPIPLYELIEHAQYRGRWVALLVSMHTCFLNAPKHGQSKALDIFLQTQVEKQRQWRRGLGITKQESDQACAYMQWCDRLSLILTQRQLATRERALEISRGPDGRRYDIIQRQDSTLNVSPWPFDVPTFTVNVEASYLRQVTFKSASDYIRHYAK